MIDNSTKSASSVDDAFLSDSEDEEIISGILSKKTLCPRQHKEMKKIDRGFLDWCLDLKYVQIVIVIKRNSLWNNMP